MVAVTTVRGAGVLGRKTLRKGHAKVNCQRDFWYTFDERDTSGLSGPDYIETVPLEFGLPILYL